MASLLRRSCSLAPARRAFSTSTPRLGSTLQWDKNNKEVLADTVPEYPHGPPRLYKQSRHGLYGEQRIRFGNNVSVKGKNKSRRSWAPNIVSKRLFSKALNRFVQVRVSSRVLRTIDKLGGLDEYLLGEKETRIRELGESGWWLRWAIMQTPTVKKRFAAEREALGLPVNKEDFLAEEEDAEASAEASTPDAEIAELSLEENADLELEPSSHVSDVMAEDDVFQVEQSKDLPPLRFRIGRNKYAMLTENGWRNLTPSSSAKAAAEKLMKDEIKRSLKAEKTKMAEERFEQLQEQAKKDIRATKITYSGPVTITKPAVPERRDAAGEVVMEEHTEEQVQTRNLTEREQKEMLSEVIPQLEHMAKKAAGDWANSRVQEISDIRSGKTHRQRRQEKYAEHAQTNRENIMKPADEVPAL